MSEAKLLPVNKDLNRERPFAAKYAQIYGTWNLMSEMWPEVDYTKLGYKTSEDVYKDCLRKGKMWKELLNFDPERLKETIL